MKEYSRQQSDFFWFLAYRNELVRDHFAKRALIRNKEILGFYDTYVEAFIEAEEKGLKAGEYIVQLCVPEGEEEQYRAEPVYFNCTLEDIREDIRRKRQTAPEHSQNQASGRYSAV